MTNQIKKGFPTGDFTPYGYLHTPKHTFLHPSGLLRSVSPLGFGWYKNGLPWYGMLDLTNVNSYLMLLRPAVRIGEKLFAEEADFDTYGVKRYSAYHSSNLMSYDFKADDVKVSIQYYSGEENVLFAEATFANEGSEDAKVTYDCTLNYGMNHSGWWGSDAATAKVLDDGIVAKILAYGDVASLQSDKVPSRKAVVRNAEALKEFRLGKEFEEKVASVPLPQGIFGSLLFELDVKPGETVTVLCALARDVRENPAKAKAAEALKNAADKKAALLAEDDAFYANVPALKGDFPDIWKRGIIYDFETLRMNIADPTGIYKHRWDTMQALAPRVVVAETAIDMMSLQYADPELVKEVFEGMFADAPEIFVPCTREDGSVNMIGMDGTECGTAPLWGSPIFVIRQVYANTGDTEWLKKMYPMLKEFLVWYMENRTDSEGWYHCNNSWESGQDGSVRFTAGMTKDDGPVESANAEFVRTADLEAAMADAEFTMADFARILGIDEDVSYWSELAERGKARVSEMFVDGWFRDFDNRNGKPFLNMGYYDPMLSMPFAMGLSTEAQNKAAEEVFESFRESVLVPLAASPMNMADNGWSLKWPPLLMTFSEALVRSGRQELGAAFITATANAAYGRDDQRFAVPMKREIAGVPEDLNVIIPGTAMETLSGNPYSAYCENYGWGALLPALIFRTVLGIRTELDGTVNVCPALPELLNGQCFGVDNFKVRGKAMNFVFTREADKTVKVSVTFESGKTLEKTLAPGEKLTFKVE